MKLKTKKISMRATMTLLLMMLTTASAWADADVIVKYLDPTAAIGAQRKSVTNPGQITAETTTIGSAGNTTWYYVSGTVTNSNRIEVSGTVNLILEDGCDFTVSRGIHVASGNALNIYAQSVANRGKLTANNYALPNYAAIGGNGGDDASGTTAGDGETAGDITIYGGTITTENSNIGGGNGGNGTMEQEESSGEPGYGGNGGNGNVTIYSGYITVSGNIGGGSGGKGQDEYGSEDNYGSNGGGTVNLSWTNTEDRIRADNYYGTVTLQKDFNGFDKGEVDNNDVLQNATLRYAGDYYIVNIGSMPEGVTATADLELNAGWRNAVEGQVVTICISGVPAGKVPVATVNYTNAYGNQTDNANNNGDGTVSFVMPATDVNGVTITAELKKDIANCTVTVPDQTLGSFSYINYKFWEAPATIGETVTDGETTLTRGTDYEFGSITYADMTNHDESDMPNHVGDECLVEIRGIGDYARSKYVRFDIVNPSGNGTWGNLSWALSDGTLTISGSGDMVKPQNNGTYPWLTYKSYINTITIGKDVTSIADGAFATAWNDYHYVVSEVNLPSTLKSIGADAFAYCTGATITIPVSVTSIGSGAFTEVLKVNSSLSDNADNTELVSLLSAAKGSDVTLKGRTLKKDGSWNSLCLPFGVDGFASTPLDGATVLELDVDGYYANNTRYLYNENDKKYYDGSTEYQGEVSALRQTGLNGSTVRIYFIEVTSIEAGKPYLVKWEGTSGTVENPEFTDVKVLSTTPIEAISADGKVKFVGSYNPYASTGSAFLKESADASAQNAFRAFVKVNSAETLYSNQACTEAATILQTGNSMVYYVKNTFVLTEADGVTGLTAHAGATDQLVSFTRSGLTANAYSTMCLPFSFKAPSACTFYAFTGIEWNSTNKQWEATITQQDADATLNAHTPYIFKCAENEATFTSTIATVAASYGDTELNDGAVTATTGDDKAWTFKGTYSAISWASGNPDVPTYGFSTYVPYNDGNTDNIAAGTFVRFIQGASLAPFRARLIYSGTNSHLRASIRGTSDNADLPRYIVVRIVDENGDVTYVGTVDTATGEISNDVWFTLEGKMLTGEPAESGIYIYNGHKVSINR